MLILIMGILAVLIGFNIKSTKLKPIKIKKEWILWLFLIIQITYRFIENINNNNNLLLMIESILVIILCVFLIYNRKQISIVVTACGFILNYIAMIFNGGKMPVRFDYGVNDMRHAMITENTKFYALSDILSLPYPLNYGLLRFSIGDVFIWVGWMIIIIQLIYFNIRKK